MSKLHKTRHWDEHKALTTELYEFNGIVSTLENVPDEITQEGDRVNAKTLADLEKRIDNAFVEKENTLPQPNQGTGGTLIKTIRIKTYDINGNEVTRDYKMPGQSIVIPPIYLHQYVAYISRSNIDYPTNKYSSLQIRLVWIDKTNIASRTMLLNYLQSRFSAGQRWNLYDNGEGAVGVYATQISSSYPKWWGNEYIYYNSSGTIDLGGGDSGVTYRPTSSDGYIETTRLY